MANNLAVSRLFLLYFVTSHQCKGDPANAGTNFLVAVVDPGGLYTERQLNPPAADNPTTAAPPPATSAPSTQSTSAQGQTQGQTTAATSQGQGQGQTTNATTLSVTTDSQNVTTTQGVTTTMQGVTTDNTTATTENTTEAAATTASGGSKRKKRAVSDTTGLELHILTSSVSTVDVNVTSPLQNGLQMRRVQLVKGQVQVVKLSLDFTSTGGGTGNKGIRITASQKVSVHVFAWSSGVAYSFTALPTDKLGSQYYAVSYSPQGNGAKYVEKPTTAAPAGAMTTTVTSQTSQGNGVTSQSSMTSQSTQTTGMTSTAKATTTTANPTTSVTSKSSEGTTTATESPTTAAASLSEPDACHFVLVAASEAATSVQVQLPGSVRCLQNGQLAASPFTYTLNSWQTNLLTCFDDITGIKITASKPVATYAGKRKTTECVNEAMVEQMWPTNALGRKFFFPGAALKKIVRILATNDTFLQITSGSSSTSVNLKTGQFTELGETTSDVTITSNAQVYVIAAILQTSSNSDLALVTVLPFGQYVSEAAFAQTTKQTTSPNAAKVVFTASDTSEFQLNDAATSWSWTGTTNKYYVQSTQSGVYSMSQGTKTKVAAAYTTGNVGSGLWAFPVGFRLASLWESCTPTTATPGDNLDNDCDGRIDEEKKDGKDDDSDTKTDEDLIYEEPKQQTNTNTDTQDDKKKKRQLMMFIILGAILGGIPIIILTYLIVRAMFCSADDVKESKVEIIGSQAQVQGSEHEA